MRRRTYGDKQAMRVLRWIRKYPGWWYLICTPDDKHMNMVMMSRLIIHLEKNKLYELIMILLMVHRNRNYVRCACCHVALEMMAENWNGNVMDREQMVREILQQLQ